MIGPVSSRAWRTIVHVGLVRDSISTTRSAFPATFCVVLLRVLVKTRRTGFAARGERDAFFREVLQIIFNHFHNFHVQIKTGTFRCIRAKHITLFGTPFASFHDLVITASQLQMANIVNANGIAKLIKRKVFSRLSRKTHALQVVEKALLFYFL